MWTEAQSRAWYALGNFVLAHQYGRSLSGFLRCKADVETGESENAKYVWTAFIAELMRG